MQEKHLPGLSVDLVIIQSEKHSISGVIEVHLKNNK